MVLMFLGGQPATAPFVLASKFFTITYFAYFLLTIPFLNFINSLAFAEPEPELTPEQKEQKM